MKEIRTYNFYNNGDQSHLNIYFKDGTQWCRTIFQEDLQRVIKEKESCFEEVIKKYDKVSQNER